MRADEVLAFWFGEPGAPDYGKSRESWFKKDAAFDGEIARRFGTTIESGLAGGLQHWAQTTGGALAQIIVLDQFTRNTFRDSPRAFAGDARALAAAQSLVASGAHLELLPMQRQFVYMPFEHAESVVMQDESMRLFRELGDDDLTEWARKHHAIVERFGRFPHRNAILGRVSTPDEIEFLKQPGSGF